MSQDTSKGVNYEWVMARYTGETAKFVAGMAAHSMGYQIMEKPDQGMAWVLVAFRRPLGPHKSSLRYVTEPRLIEKLESKANTSKEDRRNSEAPRIDFMKSIGSRG